MQIFDDMRQRDAPFSALNACTFAIAQKWNGSEEVCWKSSQAWNRKIDHKWWSKVQNCKIVNPKHKKSTENSFLQASCGGFPSKDKPIYIASTNEWRVALILISSDFDPQTASYQLPKMPGDVWIPCLFLNVSQHTAEWLILASGAIRIAADCVLVACLHSNSSTQIPKTECNAFANTPCL